MAEVLKEVGESVGQFMTDFTQTYISEMINSKIEGAIEDAIAELTPSALAKEEEEDPTEEKALEDKEAGVPPLATGVKLVGWKMGWGPDRIYHRFYDLAVFAIKPQDSVVDKVTFRHRQLQNFATTLKKTVPDLPDVAFPGKKMTGKDAKFYRERFEQMGKWFVAMSGCEKVRMHEDWLKFFKLEFDADAADRRELFFAALQAQCEKDGINWEYACRSAQRLGLDESEVDMLKVVAIEKVGRDARSKIHTEIYSGSTTSFLPVSVKTRFVSKLDSKMAGIISTSVETAWTAAEPTFKTVTDSLSKAMDSAVEPLKELFVKCMTPAKELLESKLKKKEDKEEEEDKDDSIDAKIQGLKARRFPPLDKALTALASGSSTTMMMDLRDALGDLNYTWRYTPYVQYNCGDAEILDWFASIDRLTEKHQRLTVALIDTVWVLGRGLVRAFAPLVSYAVSTNGSFDADAHEKKVKECLQNGGEKLAIDYFYLPSNLWRATWWCGSDTQAAVLKYARVTVNEGADLLGSVADKWKPTSKDDSLAGFAKAMEESLDAFIGERAWALCSLVRSTAQTMIAEIFCEIFGEAIGSISETLNDLVKALPPPLSDLKPGDIVEGILYGLLDTMSEKVVRMWAKPVEQRLADPDAKPEPWDEALASRFRYAPRIINSDDDLAKQQSSSSSDDDKKDEKKSAAAAE